ncbi:hypothetical protein FKR81_30905 [Lentzea tibetensis]|uniref:Uncharacterized protein n=1 Tax=Lentzea tibetensis TaxID=2591470 RepID=A0A563EL18_9PSEU|nr:hypothetical protein [Lentzea tibetensis]TWP47755.1 hypothetical protein FKR81_30905 [Lentzea tibetensis]
MHASVAAALGGALDPAGPLLPAAAAHRTAYRTAPRAAHRARQRLGAPRCSRTTLLAHASGFAHHQPTHASGFEHRAARARRCPGIRHHTSPRTTLLTHHQPAHHQPTHASGVAGAQGRARPGGPVAARGRRTFQAACPGGQGP